MNSGLEEIFEKLINDYDEEQEDSELRRQKKQEADLDRYINERYFKFTVPSILDSEHQEE